MIRKTLLIALTVTVLAGLHTFAGTPTPAGDQVGAKSDFDGMIVLLYSDKELRSSLMVLTDVEIIKVGERTFVAGVGADTHRENDWSRGQKIRIAWESVAGYILMTKADYERNVEAAKAAGAR